MKHDLIELTPVESLAAVAAANDLDCSQLTVAVEIDDDGALNRHDRSEILIACDEQVAPWKVPSIRDLFRGDRKPPDMTTPADEYVLLMYPIERQVLNYAEATGAPATDDDIVNAFSTIRRRPDGKSLGKLHDVLWQAAALMIGLRPTSTTEFSAMLNRLERSARHWRQFPGSIGYSEFLREQL